MRRMQQLPTVCAAECTAAGLRLNERGNALLLEGVEDDDGWFAPFDAPLVRGARCALEAALRALPPPPRTHRTDASWAFLAHPPPPPPPRELEAEKSSPGYRAMLPLRARLPAHAMGRQIAEMVRSERVVLVLGATGCAGLATRTCTPRGVADVHPCVPARLACLPALRACPPAEHTLASRAAGGKSTQVPQALLEDLVGRGEPCRLVASQPRRLAATAVAERVAAERGGSAGGTVGYKVRFEEKLGAATRLAFVTVGVLLKAMQSNPLLRGATHIIVDEVHELTLTPTLTLALTLTLILTLP